ncbi:hypothetical protein D9X30_0594 [Cupriavidus sp. U2]|nr:hypothetical protein D9X30_0594 [Cupriavidus sp. U2]
MRGAVTPEKLIRTLLSQVLYNMLFRRFVGLAMDDTAVAQAAYLQPSLLETRVAPRRVRAT